MSFNPSIPEPYSDSWREAYKYEKSDEPRLSSYQAPNGKPVPFVLGSDDFSGGQSVDTSEFPCYGYWSNNPLNEQPQEMTINGTIRGEKYIANRNALIEALRVTTDDDNCGYLDLPLWGRFPVVVIKYKIGEKGEKSGSCDILLTFKRAGISSQKRLKENSLKIIDIKNLSKKLKKTAVENFVKKISQNVDFELLSSGLEKIKNTLLSTTWRLQGYKTALNNITKKCNMIADLISQGIKTPRDFAIALVSAFSGIVIGLAEIKNSFEVYAAWNGTNSATDSIFDSDDNDTFEETNIGSTSSTFKDENISSGESIAEFVIERNTINAMQQFLSAANFRLDMETVTEQQINTKKELENLYKVLAFCACAQIFCEFSTGTYQRQEALWGLFEKLESSLELENPDLYAAVEAVRVATAESLLAQNADIELKKRILKPTPLLALSQTLGCDEIRLRELNDIFDSFLVSGVVKYV